MNVDHKPRSGIYMFSVGPAGVVFVEICDRVSHRKTKT